MYEKNFELSTTLSTLAKRFGDMNADARHLFAVASLRLLWQRSCRVAQIKLDPWNLLLNVCILRFTRWQIV